MDANKNKFMKRDTSWSLKWRKIIFKLYLIPVIARIAILSLIFLQLLGICIGIFQYIIRIPINVPAMTLYEREHGLGLSQELHSLLVSSDSIRGIILPLYDTIAPLGISLLLELKNKNVSIPIEIPHCGDLSHTWKEYLNQIDVNGKRLFPYIRVYNICQAAIPYYRYCMTYDECMKRYRGFQIKVLAILLSVFDEIMLMDADSMHFHNPMILWDTPGYIETGTFFFPDRLGSADDYLARRVKGVKDGHLSQFHTFMGKFDPSPYRDLKNIPRSCVQDEKILQNQPVHLSFCPSEYLLTSHTWNLRSGHEIDSSLLLWNKKQQIRATAILSSFIESNIMYRQVIPTSYGDKEYFFIACELAETKYTVSGAGVGTIGLDMNLLDENTVLCGDAMHFMPWSNATEESSEGIDYLEPFYINSDNILKWDFSKHQVYRTKARPRHYYPGPALKYPQECPFNITILQLSTIEIQAFQDRRKSLEVVYNAVNQKTK